MGNTFAQNKREWDFRANKRFYEKINLGRPFTKESLTDLKNCITYSQANDFVKRLLGTGEIKIHEYKSEITKYGHGKTVTYYIKVDG